MCVYNIYVYIYICMYTYIYISRWDFGRDFGGTLFSDKHSPNHQGIIGLVGLVHFNHIINNLLTIMDSYCKMDTSIFPFF
jgi:hypothetical protein